MGKIAPYQPTEKFHNYSLSTPKPFRSHTFYKEKEWTLQEQIYRKLKKVAGFLERLYPQLTDEFSNNTKIIIEKNLGTLMDDLDLMKNGLNKNPYSFSTKQLKTNQHRINEMKSVCDTLQTVSSYGYEFRNLSKIKHILHQLEHLIQPTSFERSLEKARVKKEPKTLVKAKKPKAIAKKAKPTTKKIALKKPAKKLVKVKKPRAIAKKAKPATKRITLKKSVKKVAKPKTKILAKNKKTLKAKPKKKIKSTVAHKKKLSR